MNAVVTPLPEESNLTAQIDEEGLHTLNGSPSSNLAVP